MLLSLYTSVRDGIYYDYHVVEMVKHHLPLADEIIVHDGNSSDGTYEALCNLDPKVIVFRSDWGKPDGLEWLSRFKNAARQRCTSQWCINIDCDEFIPEWEFEDLRRFLTETDHHIIPLRIINFYGNYRVFHSRPAKVPWPDTKFNIHRNLPDIVVVGDGSNVAAIDATKQEPKSQARFSCHHFGFVRNPARLRQKWRNILGGLYKSRKKMFSLPSFLFDWWPHDWMDTQFLSDLALYDGPFIRPVVEHPSEFVRDRETLYRYLLDQKVISNSHS